MRKGVEGRPVGGRGSQRTQVEKSAFIQGCHWCARGVGGQALAPFVETRRADPLGPAKPRHPSRLRSLRSITACHCARLRRTRFSVIPIVVAGDGEHCPDRQWAGKNAVG